MSLWKTIYAVAFVPLSGFTLKARPFLVLTVLNANSQPPGLRECPWWEPELAFAEGLCFVLISTELGAFFLFCLFSSFRR